MVVFDHGINAFQAENLNSVEIGDTYSTVEEKAGSPVLTSDSGLKWYYPYYRLMKSRTFMPSLYSSKTVIILFRDGKVAKVSEAVIPKKRIYTSPYKSSLLDR